MMTRTRIHAAVMLLAGSVAYAQTPDAAGQELMKLEQQSIDASVKKDRATFERLLGDDYVYTHSNGTVLNKTQELAEAMASEMKWTSVKVDDLKARVFGDVGIVTGVETLVGAAKGYVPGPRRFTDIWVKRGGRWVQIGGQSTLVRTK